MYHTPPQHPHTAHPAPAHARAPFALKTAHATPGPHGRPPAHSVNPRPGLNLVTMVKQTITAIERAVPLHDIQLTPQHLQTIQHVAHHVIPGEEVGWVVPYAMKLRAASDALVNEKNRMDKNKTATKAQLADYNEKQKTVREAVLKLCWTMSITPPELGQLTSSWLAKPNMTNAERMDDVIRLNGGRFRNADTTAYGPHQFIEAEVDTLARRYSGDLGASADQGLKLVALFGEKLKSGKAVDPSLRAEAYALRADLRVSGHLSELMLRDRAKALLANGIEVNEDTLLASQIFGAHAIKLSRLRAYPSVTFGTLVQAGAFPAAFVRDNPAPFHNGFKTTVGQFWTWIGREAKNNAAPGLIAEPQPAALQAQTAPSSPPARALLRTGVMIEEGASPQQFEAAYRQAAAQGAPLLIDMRGFSSTETGAPAKQGYRAAAKFRF